MVYFCQIYAYYWTITKHDRTHMYTCILLLDFRVVFTEDSFSLSGQQDSLNPSEYSCVSATQSAAIRLNILIFKSAITIISAVMFDSGVHKLTMNIFS